MVLQHTLDVDDQLDHLGRQLDDHLVGLLEDDHLYCSRRQQEQLEDDLWAEVEEAKHLEEDELCDQQGNWQGLPMVEVAMCVEAGKQQVQMLWLDA